jgi:hypothetical protein
MVPAALPPPATRTSPFCSSVAVSTERAVLMLPVGVQAAVHVAPCEPALTAGDAVLVLGDGALMAKGRCTDPEAADALTPIRAVGIPTVETVLLNRIFSGHVSRPEVAIVGPLVGGVVLLAGLIAGKSVSAVTAVAVVCAAATYLLATAVLRWQAANGRGFPLPTARVNDRRPS